jgi:hypothetical protein
VQIAPSEKRSEIKADVTVARRDAQAVAHHLIAVEMAAYIAAIALAGAAAWFSIGGMTVLFPGAPISVVAMSKRCRN